MSRVAVLHMLDTLEAGGAERAAVNLANHLPDRFRSYFCTTRRDGPLAELLGPEIGRLRLERRGRFDAGALVRLVGFLREREVRIVHPHGSALFMARVAVAAVPDAALVWHLHYGRYALENRRALPYRWAARRVDGLIAVNEQLAEWAGQRLRVPAARVRYIPNLVDTECSPLGPGNLPGTRPGRIVHLANVRPEKDHPTLIRAMALVARRRPDAHLLLVGAVSDPDSMDVLRGEIHACGVEGNVSYLGPRRDVAAVLRDCDIGVLSSRTEGMPMALLEYGGAGLAAVATRVGQCADVLGGGSAGIVVPPGSPEALAGGLLSLLESAQERAELGRRLRDRVARQFSPEAVIPQICEVYETVLAERE